ncbi:hypothetical protein NXW52_25430 [Bacteroides ovatus]|nr:hypothetical protein NXW52_25430 [Bacteroides ovatus]
MKKYSHVALGLFIAEQFKKAGVKIAPMCTEIGLGKAVYYAKVIKRGDVRLSHFTRLLAYFYDYHTKEEFRAKAIEWVDRYIDYREKHG